MQNMSDNSGELSRAEQFLVDDEKHMKRFRTLQEKQKQNLADLKRITAIANTGVLPPDHEKVMAERERLSELHLKIMAENDRLVAEEKAILDRPLFTRISRAFRTVEANELAAEAKIKQNALAREAKNRTRR